MKHLCAFENQAVSLNSSSLGPKEYRIDELLIKVVNLGHLICRPVHTSIYTCTGLSISIACMHDMHIMNTQCTAVHLLLYVRCAVRMYGSLANCIESNLNC